MEPAFEILIVPTAPIDEELNVYVQKHLENGLGISVSMGPMIVLPSSAMDQNRGQYEGQAILRVLQYIGNPSTYKLGLINEDCYAEGTKYIFGEAMLKGHELFVALPRLRESFYGRAENSTLFFERVYKEAVHELGHAMGLLHCPNQSCVMHYSAIFEQTDRKSGSFCPRCVALLKEYESAK